MMKFRSDFSVEQNAARDLPKLILSLLSNAALMPASRLTSASLKSPTTQPQQNSL